MDAMPRRGSTAANVRQEERLNRVFHCLADPSRRKIIALLRETGELKVGDIAGAFSMTLNGVSKHLKVLEQAELVLRRIEGREHWLRVNWAALQPAYTWLHFYQQFWSERIEALVDYVRATKNVNPKARRKKA
jgi:DNA-binding transcriptional ArsR family regulator